MSWITLTEADLQAALNDAELSSYRSKIAAEQDDPVSTILADVTAEVRGYCGAVVSLTGTTGIPHTLKNAGLDIAVYRLAKRCQFSTEEQRKPAADDAKALLERVADGKHSLDVDEEESTAGNWGSETNIFSDD